MVTINHLDVQFDVEGGDDERLFIEYFNKHIAEWNRRNEAQGRIREVMDRSRDLGDRSPGKGYLQPC